MDDRIVQTTNSQEVTKVIVVSNRLVVGSIPTLGGLIKVECRHEASVGNGL